MKKIIIINYINKKNNLINSFTKLLVNNIFIYFMNLLYFMDINYTKL